MPFPSYLSAFRAPPHANAYRQALQHQKIDFSQGLDLDRIAERAARMLLPPWGCTQPRQPSREDCGTVALLGLGQVTLQFITDKKTAAVSTLANEFDRIARDEKLVSDAAKGRAVLNAIAEKIRPALETGAVGRTQMAHAAALEIAVAIANHKHMTIGWRAAMKAANEMNPAGCKLGTPSEWGVSIVAEKMDGRVTMCESTAWDRYHAVGQSATDAKARGKRKQNADLLADDMDPDENAVAVVPHNVTCQAGPVLVADVHTTFAAKTEEWWLTRVLLRRRAQRASVVAKVQMVAFESSEKALHDAMTFEDGTRRHTAWNLLAVLCRFMRGICIGKVDRREYRRMLRFRPLRESVPPPPTELHGDPETWDTHIAACPVTRSKKAELLGKHGRRAGRRSGTWSGETRYAGKVDLKLCFLDRAGALGKNQLVEYVSSPAAQFRKPVYEALPLADTMDKYPPRGSGPVIPTEHDQEVEPVRLY